jgi:hypothetical protein
MKFGIWLPFSHAQWVTNLARLAERSGWDGVFFREQVVGLDRWIPIAAAALSTQRILIGGLISPSPRSNPRLILNEAYRIHRRSGNRLVVCLGNWFQETEQSPARTPASGVESGQFGGGDNVSESTPSLIQQLMVWRIGVWPNRDSILAALNHQGVISVVRDGANALRAPTRGELKELVEFIRQVDGSREDFEVVVEITLAAVKARKLSALVDSWEAAGASWGILNHGRAVDGAQGLERLRERIRVGPPG